MNTLWVLTDFTARNGPTQIVPGSHKIGKKPETVVADLLAPHADGQLIIAPAGTLILLNART